MQTHPGLSLVICDTAGLLIGWKYPDYIMMQMTGHYDQQWLKLSCGTNLFFFVKLFLIRDSFLRKSFGAVRTRGIVGDLHRTFQIISFLQSPNPQSSRELWLQCLYCRGVAMSQLDGSPCLEGDPLQVCLHPCHRRPEVLLLLPLRDPGHGARVRHRHRRPLPGGQAGGLRGVQGDDQHIIGLISPSDSILKIITARKCISVTRGADVRCQSMKKNFILAKLYFLYSRWAPHLWPYSTPQFSSCCWSMCSSGGQPPGRSASSWCTTDPCSTSRQTSTCSPSCWWSSGPAHSSRLSPWSMSVPWNTSPRYSH